MQKLFDTTTSVSLFTLHHVTHEHLEPLGSNSAVCEPLWST